MTKLPSAHWYGWRYLAAAALFAAPFNDTLLMRAPEWMVLHPGLFYWVVGALLAWRGDKLRRAGREGRAFPWATAVCATGVAAAAWYLHVKIDHFETDYFLSDWSPRIAILSKACRDEMQARPWNIQWDDVTHWWQRPEWEEVYEGVSPQCAGELRALPPVPRIKLVVRP